MSESYVHRTCTRLIAVESGGQREAGSAPLSAYRSEQALVLLGDAGAGKSREFRRECEQLGDTAVLRSARDFVTFDVRPDWRDKTLFIDGLDEVRAGTSDGRPALDEIRGRLDQLDWPKYRISCREADWLGSNDRRSLETETPGGTVAVLRLDPLGSQAQRTLLGTHIDGNAVSEFLAEADRQGLGGMLANPLTLEMLASAVSLAGGAWPVNRREIFELACRRMAQEHNREHLAATVSVAPTVEDLLIASGELCALTLLSGVESVSLGLEDDASPWIVLNELRPMDAGGATDSLSLRRHVLRTKLFSAANGPTSIAERPMVSPIHRQIAEFLGGRYLAGLVKSGLPARRIVALMISPHDGRVVTSLRGLSAWLSAHSGEALDMLIEADPVGIGLYGDISGLGGERKQRLLRALASYATASPLLGHQWRDDPDAGYRDSTAWAFRSIVDAETVEVVAELLHGQADDPASDRIAAFLLRVLTEAEGLSKVAASRLATVALGIARKQQWSADTRRAGLEAFMSLETDRDTRDDALATLLTDIAEHRLTDPEDDLAGLALSELYPRRVSPDEIWSYLEIRTHEQYYGAFASFWNGVIVNQSSAHDAADALDALWANLRQEGLRFGIDEVLRRRAQDMVPVDLLVKALDELGDNVDITRLFGWLVAAATCGSDIRPDSRRGLHDALLKAQEHVSPQDVEELGNIGDEDQAATDRYADPAGPVRAWLEQRPETQRWLYLEWLKIRCGDSPIWDRAWFLGVPLFYSRLPRDLGRWCLAQALAFETTDPGLAQDILGHVVGEQLTDAKINEGLTLDFVSGATESSPALSAKLERLLAAVPLDGKRAVFEAEMRELARKNRRKEREHRQEWADHIRDNLCALSDGSFPLNQLDYLARIHFGHRPGSNREGSGEDPLAEFLENDDQLTAAVKDALIAAVFRAELPEVDESISLHAESKYAWAAWPLFAGLQLSEHNRSEGLDSLDDERKRRVVATYFCVPNSLDRPPPWLSRWLTVDPELVSDVLVRCSVGDFRAGGESSTALNELNMLGFDDATEHRVRLHLLKAFPTSAPMRQLKMLDSLLFGVLRGPAITGVQDVIEAKLAAKSLTVAQRARWLAAAVLLFQDRYVAELAEFATRHHAGSYRLAEFLHHELGPRWGRGCHFAALLEPTTLEVFIEVLGHDFEPLDPNGDHTVAVNAAEWVSDFINQLSDSAKPGATEALLRLEQLPEMSAWRSSLRHARDEQNRLRSDTEYRLPTVSEVQRTLGGGVPANAADLAALLLDRLDDIAEEMRGSPADPWRPFWNEDEHGRPTGSKPENSCRDALMSLLQSRLPPDVEVTAEASYAADKRADLRASCNGFNVPVEIKKNSSRDLWHAMRSQLTGQYTTDPATDGYGIYLVLWFEGENVPPSSSGRRPTSPQELKEMLEQNLSTDEARKISVRVIDLTKPGAA